MPHVTDGEIQTLTDWKKNIPNTVYELGGCDCEVYKEGGGINIYTDLGSTKRKILLDWCKEHRPAGTKVTIRHVSQHTDDVDESEVLTDVELYDVLGALPDDCSNGIDLDEVDVLKLHPYIKKYGSFPELLDAVGKSVDSSHSSTESVDDGASSSHQPEPETAQQSIERVCEEYVSGEIETVLELEDELEAPVTKQLQAEGLLA